MQQVSLVRPFDFSEKQYHLDRWKEKNITVLICQRKTHDLIRLSLESILRFYPDIPILIVDGNSHDDSLLYLRYMAVKHSNIILLEQPKADPNHQTSHGVTMDMAIKNHIKTKYVLLMDSDVIVERGGLIEDMREEFSKDDNLCAIGSLMLVTRSNHACGPPKDETDILRYAHPSFSIYDVNKYHELKAPFSDHGAPCVYTMLEAEKRGMHVKYYPVDKYVSHLSGGSWTDPRTIWANDHDVFIRPFISFIVSNGNHIEKLQLQTDHDFDIITPSKKEEKHIVVHGSLPVKFSNNLYGIRHQVTGEYVCFLAAHVEIIQPEFVHVFKQSAIEKKMPDELNVGGLNLIKRTLWQRRESLQ